MPGSTMEDELLPQSVLVEELRTLNQISQALNQAADVQSALNTSLAELVKLLHLETAWVFVSDPLATDRWSGRGFRLAAFHNLPPALSVTDPTAWDKDCDCQNLCKKGELSHAYNEVTCSRLASTIQDSRGLAIHASAPLRSGGQTLGILNVAAHDWSAFTSRSLAFLTNVANQMGIAMGRARLFDLLQEQRFHEQAALLDLSQQLLSRREVNVLMAFIAEEARRMLNADAAALLMPGEKSEFLQFRAASGWRGDPVSQGYLVPKGEETASGRAMISQQAVVLDDAWDEEARVPLWNPEWLAEEGFVSLAVVPMIADGVSIGVLVIDSRRPRRFEEPEVRLMRLMANQAALAIEKARLHEEELGHRRLEEEMAVGRRIQLSMLPSRSPEIAGWQFARYFEAAHQVAGDFYDFFYLPGDDGRLGIVVADVSDKGVAAALFMALSRTTLRNAALRGRPPSEVMFWTNRFIQEDSQTDMFLTAFYAELDPHSGRLTYANAGHNPPLLWHQADQQFELLHPNGALLGILEDVHFTEKSIELLDGDILVLYTDGITEAFTEDYEEFGLTRLRDSVAAVLENKPAATADEILAAIRDALHTFVGSTLQFDDITLVVIRRQ